MLGVVIFAGPVRAGQFGAMGKSAPPAEPVSPSALGASRARHAGCCGPSVDYPSHESLVAIVALGDSEPDTERVLRHVKRLVDRGVLGEVHFIVVLAQSPQGTVVDAHAEALAQTVSAAGLVPDAHRVPPVRILARAVEGSPTAVLGALAIQVEADVAVLGEALLARWTRAGETELSGVLAALECPLTVVPARRGPG